MNIAKKRKEKGYSQKEFAIMAGVKSNALSNYELGKREPSIKILIRFADILNCTIDELVRGE